MKKINILLCDTFPGLLPPFVSSYDAMLRDLFLDVTEEEISFQTYEAYKGELPEKIFPNELYLIPGSNSGVYEDKPWIKLLLAFIRRADLHKAPLVGICFGHQAIAQALGGEVKPAEKGWGTGIRTSTIIRSNGLIYFPEGTMNLHYNHHDQVVKLPPEGIAFATSGFCSNEGFMMEDHILTFQGHPEYTDEYSLHLLINHADDEPEEIKKEAIKSIKEQEHQGKTVAKWILSLLD